MLTSVIHNEFVHAPGAEGGADGLSNHLAGIDVANKLGGTLGGVCAFLQQDNRCGLQGKRKSLPSLSQPTSPTKEFYRASQQCMFFVSDINQVVFYVQL